MGNILKGNKKAQKEEDKTQIKSVEPPRKKNLPPEKEHFASFLHLFPDAIPKELKDVIIHFAYPYFPYSFSRGSLETFKSCQGGESRNLFRESSAYDQLFKLTVVGDSKTGKTSLLKKFSEGKFNPDEPSTIGVDFSQRTLTVHRNGQPRAAKLQLWDTAGDKRFRSISTGYYRGASGVIAVFDVGNRESFDYLKNEVIKDIGNQTNNGCGDMVPVLVLGNHRTSRQVTTQEALDLCEHYNFLYFEVDVKSNTNEAGSVYWPILMLVHEC